MKTIRPNVFETNSSSDHLICFPSVSMCDNISTTPQSIYINGDGKYGWGYEILNTPEALLDYWLVAVKTQLADEYTEEARTAIVDYFHGHGIKLHLPETIDDVTGYIDHQSVNDASAMLAGFIANPEALFKFAFCPNTKIIIDNDNH